MPCVVGNQFDHHAPVVPHLLFCSESFDLADGDLHGLALKGGEVLAVQPCLPWLAFGTTSDNRCVKFRSHRTCAVFEFFNLSASAFASRCSCTLTDNRASISG